MKFGAGKTFQKPFNMKNLILILGLCAFLAESAVIHEPDCVMHQCLTESKGCEVYGTAYKFAVPETNKDATCTGEYGPGKLTHCCPTENDAKVLKDQLSWKVLARALTGAEENEYPHQVKFQTRGACGGTVYNKNWIITAAHCVRSGNDPATYTSKTGESRRNPNSPVKQAYVIAGTSHVRHFADANKYEVDNIIWHEKWNPTEIGDGYDIALLHLKRPLALEKGKIQPIRLESADHIPNYGGNGLLVGFGNVDERLGLASDDLMETVAPIQHKANGVQLSFDRTNAEEMGTGGSALNPLIMAIGGGDSGVVVGQGDSGGPFICGDKNNKPILCGISSYKSCDSFKLCRKASYSTRISPMLEWIKKNTNNERQEEELFIDEPLFPQKIAEKEVPLSLVRVTHGTKSCTGVIITKKLVLTTAECGTLDGPVPIVLHLRSETGLTVFNLLPLKDYKPSLSQNVTKILGKPIPGSDMGIIILKNPVPEEYVTKLAPSSFREMKGRSVEYTFNPTTSSVEKRNYLEMDKESCAKKLKALDSNLELRSDQLCMRQVYSAEKDCKRDLGGMLLCENETILCGISSFRACNANGFPEIFANYLHRADSLYIEVEPYTRTYA